MMKVFFAAVVFAAEVLLAGGDVVPLVNGGFEMGAPDRAAGWTKSPAYRLAPGSGMNGSGALAFALEAPITNFLPAVSQPVELKPGVAYRARCRVRTENVVKHPGNPRGAAIGMEWRDGNGKLNGAYSRDYVGSHDWSELVVETPRMPRGVSRARVQVYVGYGSTTGRAWFDDVVIEPVEQPPVGTLITSVYRSTAAAGEVDFLARIDCAATNFAAAGHSVRLEYRNAAGRPACCRSGGVGTHRPTDGTICGVGEVEFTEDLARFRVKVEDLALGEQQVALALVDPAGREIGRSETKFTRTVEPVRRRVFFDRFNRTIVDGRPFFPLGMYCGQAEEKEMVVYREGPFNCLMPYNEPSREQLDWLHAHDLMVIYPLKEVFEGRAWSKERGILTEQDEIAYITKRVNAFKDHPAVLAWYLNDELSVDFVPRLTMHQRLFERLDADHPTWNLLYQVNQLERYLTAFDVIGSDPYPIPGHSLGMAAEWAVKTRDCSMRTRPAWQVPQAMSWGWFPGGKSKKGCRMPTRGEMRSMTWQAIAGGANGLIYYAFHQMRRNSGERFGEYWEDVKAVAQEVKRFEAMLLAGDPPPAFTCTAPETELVVRTFAEGGRRWLVAAGADEKPVRASVKLKVGSGKIEKLFGDGEARLENGAIAIDMPVHGVLVVEL